METIEGTIQPHHLAAASMWGTGGPSYDDISFVISDALAHAAQRLNATAGQRVLDVATGTGWSARNAARAGAEVTAVDISPELLQAARELSADVRPAIHFRLADAERLPFESGSFDGVISTFGVMFARDQALAARELGRVCRRGGRLALAVWAPEGAVATFFGVLAQYGDGPLPPASPLAWGDPQEAQRLLGADFELAFEPGVSNAYHDDVEAIWGWYTRGFGPLRQLVETLDPERRKALRREVDAYHSHYLGPAGLHIRREYLAILGRRR